jgi:hypothetical protein
MLWGKVKRGSPCRAARGARGGDTPWHERRRDGPSGAGRGAAGILQGARVRYRNETVEHGPRLAVALVVLGQAAVCCHVVGFGQARFTVSFLIYSNNF